MNAFLHSLVAIYFLKKPTIRTSHNKFKYQYLNLDGTVNKAAFTYRRLTINYLAASAGATSAAGAGAASAAGATSTAGVASSFLAQAVNVSAKSAASNIERVIFNSLIRLKSVNKVIK